MTNPFIDAVVKATNKTRTENGAVTYKSTLNACLDLFAMGGAKRNDLQSAERLFNLAYAEDKQLALRTLFYLRDIRGGQGERDVFRTCMRALHKKDTEAFNKVVIHTPEYGRWDDIIEYVDEKVVVDLVKQQITADLNNDNCSLLGKWMPSENATNRETISLARKWIKKLGLSARQYRKTLSVLRAKIKILESKMCAHQWSKVVYEQLPSLAFAKHIKAFKKHDDERLQKYLQAVSKGKAKINTSTLYTYDVFDVLRNSGDTAATAFWNNLPDYTQGKNAIVVADVSGSMQGRPMDVSVSLALYFAERNKGFFNGYFITFSKRPELVKVVGDTLEDKLHNIENANWGYATNLESVFKLIAKSAEENNLTQDDLPETIYIISDMEFNAANKTDRTLFEDAKRKFVKRGYKLPSIVFWNVNSRQNNIPATNELGVTLISGSSPSAFKYAIENKTPLDLMLSVVNGERYKRIAL